MTLAPKKIRIFSTKYFQPSIFWYHQPTFENTKKFQNFSEISWNCDVPVKIIISRGHFFLLISRIITAFINWFTFNLHSITISFNLKFENFRNFLFPKFLFGLNSKFSKICDKFLGWKSHPRNFMTHYQKFDDGVAPISAHWLINEST